MDCLKEGRLYIRDSLSVKFAFLKRTAKIHFCNSGKFYQIHINKSDIMKIASTFNKIVTRFLLKQQRVHK